MARDPLLKSVKILLVHNFYQQPGGEDQVFRSESRMLEKHGHTVLRFTESNDRVPSMGKLELAMTTVWNRNAYSRLRALVMKERPDVVHFHNTFPLLSPSCYYAARAAGAAVVQTLHNYRLLCPAATLLRDGRPCEDCVGNPFPWHGIQHACYRGSRVASAGVAVMLGAHHAISTWTRAVDTYIALTHFSRERFIAGGLPAERISVKPNFMEPDPGMGSGGNYYLYAGRLSPEKGLDVLVKAWQSQPAFPTLRIVGDGPQSGWLREQIRGLENTVWMGRMSREQVIEQMKNAKALVLPSIWYENFPVTVVEAFATGLPVIASDAGTLPELVENAVTGYVFRSDDAQDLAQRVLQMEKSGDTLQRMRTACRAQFTNSYGEDRNYLLLENIYCKAVSGSQTNCD